MSQSHLPAYTVRGYADTDARDWDELVARSGAGTILHTRRFLSYHGDRFRDRSLLVVDARGRMVGVLPAAESPADPSVVISHPGLTYGGLVHDGALFGEHMIRVLEQIAAEYRSMGLSTLRYKAVPSIYHSVPAADDVYALFRLGASRYGCDLAAAIDLDRRRPLRHRRERGRKRALGAGVRVEEGWGDIAAYWQILEHNLDRRHQASPTHTLAEIEYLHAQFPKEFLLVAAKIDGILVGGEVYSVEGPVLQGRYSATTVEGRAASATDLVIERAIMLAQDLGCRYYSHGTSTMDEGRWLNEAQYDFKVSFVAGGVVHDHYELGL